MKTQIVINAKIYTGQEIVENGFIRYAETIKEIGLMAQYVPQENETVLMLQEDCNSRYDRCSYSWWIRY